MGKPNTLGLLAVGCLLVLARGAHAQSLANPGFESGPILCEIVEQFGVWSVDGGAAVGAMLGITPIEGSAMLRLQETAPCCARVGQAAGSGADVGQLVDLSAALGLIQSGNARLVVSAAFNRVAGNTQTDTAFSILVRAFDEPTLDGFRTDCSGYLPWIAQSQMSLISDASPITWERAGVALDLPTSSTFVYVYVSAIENVSNGLVYGQEFDGHFADDVRFEVRSVCPADFNSDGFVNGDDYDAFAESFEIGDLGADLNDDGFVNGDDYDTFAEHFEAGC